MKRSYAILCKPAGSSCNLNCDYCYYLEKKNLLKQPQKTFMNEAVLESFIKENLRINTIDDIEFVWQGGEPMLCGIDFYKKALYFQKKYNDGKKIRNILQTNGILLDNEWGEFLKENNFLLGISLDGPEDFHNQYRRDKQGKPTFEKVLQGLDVLKKYEVDFNTLTVLNKHNTDYPEALYGFLKIVGSGFMQFIPLIERDVAPYEKNEGMHFSEPPEHKGVFMSKQVSDFSITPAQFSNFYKTIFDIWRKEDVGHYFIQLFEATIGNHLNKAAGICVNECFCGHGAALEYNGDLYSCDHFVYDGYLLGNIMTEKLDVLMDKNKDFGLQKYLDLPDQCLACSVLKYCHGGCMKDRFLLTKSKQKGLNYLCEGYLDLFGYMAGELDGILGK